MFNCKYTLAPKCQVYNLLCAWDLSEKNVLSFWQADLNRKTSDMTELWDTLKFQEIAALKFKDELTLALASIEKLKKDFEKERSD